MPAMECQKCGGDIDFDVERVTNGDGPWAQSGWVAAVWAEPPGDGQDGHQLPCGCVVNDAALEALNDRATELAGEWPDEP